MPVETWLRFLQSGEARGYVHEVIAPVSNRLYHYEYLHEGDLDMMVKPADGSDEQPIHWDWKLTAKLTETFDPYHLEATSNMGGLQWRLDIRTVGDKRVMEIVLPPTSENPEGTPMKMELRSDDPVATTLELLMYKLRRVGDLAKPGEVKYQILGAAGMQAIPLDFRVEPAELKKYAVNADRAFVTPVSVEGAPADTNLPIHLKVYVDKYGRIVEAEGRDVGTQFILCKDAAEAKGGEGVIGAKGRRDPFVKTLTPKSRGVEPPGTPPPDLLPTILPERLGAELTKAEGVVLELERYVKASDRRAEASYQKFLRLYEALRKACAGDVIKLNQLDAAKGRAEEVYGGAERLVKQARSYLDAADDYYRARNEQGVQSCLDQIKKLRAQREFFQDERALEMDHRIIPLAEKKLVQTRIRIELEKKTVLLSGTVVKTEPVIDRMNVSLRLPGGTLDISEPVKIIRHVAYAIINERLYGEGEVVEDQGVRIDKIQPDWVEISYKGELRTVSMLKSSKAGSP